MKLQTDKIRNISIVGHSGAGKTLFSEACAFCAGAINRMGSIQSGNTLSDYRQDEIDRQMSVHSTLMSFEHNDTFYNFIDTPGYADFIGDTKSSMQVCDLAFIVVNAVHGLQIGSERVWKYADEFNQPKIICINGLDHENVSFSDQMKNLKEQWGHHVVPIQIPVNEGPSFQSVIDLASNKLLTWEQNGNGKWTESEIPEEYADLAATYRQGLIDAVAESNDALLEKYLETGDLSEEEVQTALFSAIENKTLFPVVCSSADKNVGPGRILQLLSKYAPPPSNVKEITDLKGDKKEVGPKSPACAFVFKTTSEQHVGELSFFRVYSGTIKSGDELKNTSQSSSERFNQLFIINGKNKTDVAELPCGAIATAVKLKNTHTGDTLASSKGAIQFPPTTYPEPCINFAVAPKSKGEEDKFSRALSAMHEEDPTFAYEVNPETKQTVVSGMGEIHIDIMINQIKSRYNIEVLTGKPKVPFRETIRVLGESKYRHKKQSGGAGQFAEVWIRVSPLERGGGIEFTESLVGQNVDRNFVPSVEKGVNYICNEGVIASCKVVDLKIDFYDGKMHSVDSNDMAFQLAGRGAFKQAFESAQPYLLEPIYEVEIRVPSEYMGDVIGDISSRRGQVQGMDADGQFQIVKAQLPQANLYKYSTTLRSISHGTAEHIEKFSHYEEMPSHLADKVIEEYKANKTSDENAPALV